jgi:hypothetical protein
MVMPHDGTWFSYDGTARLWLGAGLLAITALAAGAGIWGPRATRARQPTRTVLRVTLVVWAVAIPVWLIGLVLYVKEIQRQYHLTLAELRPPDRVAPITFLAAVVLFVAILRRRPAEDPARVPGAAIGVFAALSIFELPFDLIVMARIYPPGPAAYLALFFAPLFVIEVTSLLLTGMSPMVKPTRATCFSLALMFGVFAVWALTGFGYPSAPLPFAFNVISKLLAFVTAATLFFPGQPGTAPVPRPEITAPRGPQAPGRAAFLR